MFLWIWPRNQSTTRFQAGADANAPDGRGMTPLFVSASPDMTTLLVAFGGDPRRRSKAGLTADEFQRRLRFDAGDVDGSAPASTASVSDVPAQAALEARPPTRWLLALLALGLWLAVCVAYFTHTLEDELAYAYRL